MPSTKIMFTILVDYLYQLPLIVLLLLPLAACLTVYTTLYILLLLFAPRPRPPSASEKTYITASQKQPQPLPSWHDEWTTNHHYFAPADPNVQLSIVIPAYNEAQRLGKMLAEALEYLRHAYPSPRSYEILVVSDGSTDATVDVALEAAAAAADAHAHVEIRVVQLRSNRGKGGAVIHGLRHVRGRRVLFVDADGATRFSDFARLEDEAERLEREQAREIKGAGGDAAAAARGAVVIGSRAHLVGSDAVVKRSFLRNLLMYAFHLFIRLLTTPRTSRIADTQCGFKLLSRAALPYIVPYMHSEGWIFDVEMLMLAEAAGIPVAEVPVAWREVHGSKLHVVWDSLGMAAGLAVMRAAWEMGVWEKPPPLK